MKQLKEIYQDIVDNKAGQSKAYQMHKWSKLWKTAVDNRISQNTEPYKIVEDVLFVITSSSVWAHELTQLKNEIINKINQHAAPEKIKDVVFKSGKLKKDQAIKIEKRESIMNSENTLINYQQHKKNMQDKGWVECGKCGTFHAGPEKECIYCTREKKESKEKELYKIIRHAPWLTTKEIKKEVKNADYATIEKTKRNIIAQIKDEINQVMWDLRGNMTKNKFKIFKNIIYEYTMHRSSKHPKDVDMRTVKKYLPKRIIEIMEKGEELVKNGQSKKRK